MAGDAVHAAGGDELLLRQTAPAGIADITPTRAGRLVFLPNGLLNSNNNAINFDASAERVDEAYADAVARVEAARRGEAIGRVFMAATDGEARDRVLISQRGIGAWTSAEKC